MGALVLVRLEAALLLFLLVSSTMAGYNGPNQRPPPSQRKFSDPAIEQVIASFNGRMKDPELAHLFINCFPNTLDTTVMHFDPAVPDTYIVTGDIDAMWLRDSSAQVAHYIPFLDSSKNLQNLVLGVILRQASYINADPYANAFNFGPTGSPHSTDKRIPPMKPIVFEGKYELDSLMWPLRLASLYYNKTGDTAFCTKKTWQSALFTILGIVEYQRASTVDMDPSQPLYYCLLRKTTTTTETLMAGVGTPGRRCGMSKSPFRPSDDSHIFPFPIGANAMAAVVLGDIARILSNQSSPCYSSVIAASASRLSDEIRTGLLSFGTTHHPHFGRMFAYEVDGQGSSNLMDDANIPGLLSLPYLGFLPPNDKLYLNTRKFLLSEINPYFANGTAGHGIGGPHIGQGWIWPISIATQALTSTSDEEILQCLELLKSTHAGTYFMHESFWKDDATRFTRPWFAWANSLFGELIVTLARTRPHLIFNSN